MYTSTTWTSNAPAEYAGTCSWPYVEGPLKSVRAAAVAAVQPWQVTPARRRRASRHTARQAARAEPAADGEAGTGPTEAGTGPNSACVRACCLLARSLAAPDEVGSPRRGVWMGSGVKDTVAK